MTSDNSAAARSAEACPVCGAHALHLIYFPNVDVTGARQYDDMLGFGDARRGEEPGIGCESCGSDWPDLAAFRAAQRGEQSGTDDEPADYEPAPDEAAMEDEPGS